MTAPVGEHECAQACGSGIRHGPGWLSGDGCTVSQRGLLACEPRGMLGADAASRGCSSKGQARQTLQHTASKSVGGEGTVQKDRLWVSVEVGFVVNFWAALSCDWA